MDIIIEKQESKPLLKREEIKAVIKSNTTPTRAEAKEMLASKLNKNAELIAVKGIYKKFGASSSEIFAYAYDSKDALEKIEPKPKAKKEKAQGSENTENKPETKPVEKKPEVKPEAKHAENPAEKAAGKAAEKK